MDKTIRSIATLGVPGLVLMAAMEFTGYAGAVAMTTALAAIGPGGMIGGVMSLVALGWISNGIAEMGFDALAKSVLKELYRKGESKETIKKKIKKYPVSKKLKRSLYQVVDEF